MNIRHAGIEDLWSLHWLRGLAGWNQSLAFWNLVLRAPAAEVFVAAEEARVVGSAMLWSYGNEVDWIGMVIVHPAYRRHGIGRKLLEACLATSAARGVRSIGLDATPSGRPLYRSLGFQEGQALDRWRRSRASKVGQSRATFSNRMNGLEKHIVEQIWKSGFDQQSFGVSRESLCAGLAADAIAVCSIMADQYNPLGYGMLRHGARRSYLGPLVAENEAAGECLADELLSLSPPRSLLWDIPRSNQAALAYARKHGFAVQRSFVRMWKGPIVEAPRFERVWGIADPALG